MRDFEAGCGENQVAIEQDVEVECAWAVWRARGAVAAEVELDREKTVQQIARRKMRFKRDDGIQKAGLIFKSDGRSGVERRTRGDAA